MRVFADSNITAPAVKAMREAGLDVVYSGERAVDPGDEALLAEAAAAGRVFLTKDHDIGALVHVSSMRHAVEVTARVRIASTSSGRRRERPATSRRVEPAGGWGHHNLSP